MIKSLILSLLLFISVNAQWYVDKDATGDNDGSDWANAWTDMDSIWTTGSGGVNWHIIGDGDTIYVSDGTYASWNMNGYYDSGLPFTGGNQVTFGTEVVVCEGKYAPDSAGHGGEVIIENTNEDKIAFSIGAISNIKFIGIEVRHYPNTSDANQQCAIITSDSLVTLEDFNFISDGSSSVLTFTDAVKCSLINSTLETLTNHFPSNQDILGLTNGSTPLGGGHYIYGNTLIGRPQYDSTSGTADGAVTYTGSTLTDTRQSMVTNYHAGARIYAGAWIQDVVSNTSTSFTGTGSWSFSALTGYEGTPENTATSTSWTDTRLALETDYYIGALLTVGSSTMTITSNTSNTFNGSSWTGGQPSDGLAYTVGDNGATEPPDGRSYYIGSNAHFDMIQIGGESSYGDDRYLTTTFANNFLWVFNNTGFPTSNIIYANGTNKQRFVLYNNLVVSDVGTPVSPCAFTDNEVGQRNTIEIYNNTFINNNGSPIYVRPVDSVWIKNNIIISNNDQYEQVLTIGHNQSVFDTCYKDVDYNYYYTTFEPVGDIEIFVSASSAGTSRYTYTEWITKYDDSPSDLFIHTDEHSDTGYISLADVRDSVTSAYMPATQLQGTDLSSLGLFTIDINGVTRTNWTIGALEYQAPSIPAGVKRRIVFITP